MLNAMDIYMAGTEDGGSGSSFREWTEKSSQGRQDLSKDLKEI